MAHQHPVLFVPPKNSTNARVGDFFLTIVCRFIACRASEHTQALAYATMTYRSDRKPIYRCEIHLMLHGEQRKASDCVRESLRQAGFWCHLDVAHHIDSRTWPLRNRTHRGQSRIQSSSALSRRHRYWCKAHCLQADGRVYVFYSPSAHESCLALPLGEVRRRYALQEALLLPRNVCCVCRGKRHSGDVHNCRPTGELTHL